MRLILFALCLAVAAAVALWSPLHWARPHDTTALGNAAFVPEAGHAFLVPFTGGGTSDQHGRSSLRLREDGRELAPHSSHERIRTVGAGCFSHWGDGLYMATSDNTDPRTNGRRYEVLLPARVSAQAGWLPGVLLAVAAVLAAAGVLRERRAQQRVRARAGMRPVWLLRVARLPDLAAGLVCVLAVLVAHAGGRVHATRERLQAISAALLAPTAQQLSGTAISSAVASDVATTPRDAESAGADASAPVPSMPPSPPPRLVRLLDDPSALSFVPSRAASETASPRVLASPASPAPSAGPASTPLPVPATPRNLCTELVLQLPNSVSLAPGELRGCASPLDLAPGDVAALYVPVRVLHGERLRVRFVLHSRDASQAPERHVDLDLPLEPVSAWQTLKLIRPLRLADRDQQIGSDPRITDVQVGNAAPTGQSLELELGSVRIVPAAALFANGSHGCEPLDIAGSLRPAYWQSVSGETAVPLPGGVGRLVRGAVALARCRDADLPVSYRLDVVDATGARRAVLEGEARASQGWCEIEALLPQVDEPARLLFGTDALPDDAVLAWSALRCIDTNRPARRVLMVLADTLRADAVGGCGAASGTTPALEALATQGAAFTQCYSQAYWTRPSLPSIFTGHYVAATGVQELGQRLAETETTLAERFAAAGFHTLACLSNGNAGPAAGLDQGFDEVCLWTDVRAMRDTEYLLSELVSPRLQALPDEDLFAYVHLMEAHGPYGPVEPPPGWQPAPDGDVLPWEARFDPPWHAQPTAETRRALYRADVAHLDRSLGEFLDRWLATWDGSASRPTVVALLADHGESLGEDGRWGHGWSRLLPPVLHVPLILRAPGVIAPGSRCDVIVQNLDVGETLLDLAGAPVDGRAGAGRSLLPLLRGQEASAPETALASAESGGSRLFTVITRNEMLVGENGGLAEWRVPGSLLPDVRCPPISLWDAVASPEAPFLAVWERYLAAGDLRRARMMDASAQRTHALDAASLEQFRVFGYLGR